MARETIIRLIDDLDGTTADKTVSFMFEGVRYEVDLTEGHFEEFASDLAKWIEAARRVGITPTRKPASKNSKVREIREWAREQGMDVPERGRLSEEIMTAWEARNEADDVDEDDDELEEI